MKKAKVDYISSKISHLARVGLITGNHDGRGIHGGACPTELFTTQQEELKRSIRMKKRGALK